jgi:drug/metabolite transporter (DMT)-like permease
MNRFVFPDPAKLRGYPSGGIRAAWIGASPSLRGAFWLLVSGGMLAAMSVVIRICARELHPFEIVFFRNLFSLFMIWFWLQPNLGRTIRSPAKIGLYTLRAAISLLSILAWFYAVTVLPLSTATAINFTTPLFATIGAIMILGESANVRRWLTIVIGFVGVIVVLHPGGELIRGDAWIVLVSAAASGMSIVTVKFLSRTETPEAIVAYFTLLLLPMSLVPALFVWTWPSALTLLWLLLLAVMATLAQLFATRAYALADAGYLAPFEFGRLVFAVTLGYLFFSEQTSLATWLGGGLIAIAAANALRNGKPSRGVVDNVTS